MRVISQNGMIDIPYDLSMLWVGEKHGYSIMAGTPNSNLVSLGVYSSKEKAIKAMEMLRDAHTRPIVKCFHLPQNDEIEV